MEPINLAVFRKFLSESGLTYKELAKHEIHKKQIAAILEGRTKKIPYRQAVKFSRVFGVPYSDLFPDTRKIERIIRAFAEVE
jgi:transcriptional regulator with XRE-family HTH domain